MKTIHCNFVAELHNINKKTTKLQRKAQFHFRKQMPHSKCVMGKIYNAHYIKEESMRHLCQANITIQIELGLWICIANSRCIFVVNSRVINDHTSYFNFILGIPMNYFSSQIPNGKLHLNYWFYDLHFDVVSLLVCSLAELVCAWLWTATAIKTVMAHSQLEVWAIFWCKFQLSFFLYKKTNWICKNWTCLSSK